MESRTPQGAIAWALGLVTFPYLAVPAYWVFGRSKFHGFVKLLRDDHERACDTMNSYVERLRQKRLIVFPDRQDELPVEKLAKLPFTTGNQAELLVDGEQTFASVFEGIDRARDYVLVQFYIIKSDGLGNELRDRLIAAAKRNVRVYFLYDEIGSLKLGPAYLNELRNAGIEPCKFNTTKGRTNRFQLNFRNHRKIVVVDGKEAWVGGHNVGDEYLGESAANCPLKAAAAVCVPLNLHACAEALNNGISRAYQHYLLKRMKKSVAGMGKYASTCRIQPHRWLSTNLPIQTLCVISWRPTRQ